MTHPAGGRGAIGPDAFSRLLEGLHHDPDHAALEYERLRRALVKFFDWRGAWPPDECADETLDRLAQKLGETDVQDVRKYAYGIARLVALERRRGPVFSGVDEVPARALAAPPANDDMSEVHDCFERCLSELPEEGRRLILGYYEGERSAKISNRRRLAAMLGVSDTALRNRVQRLRDRVEQCVQACTSRLAGGTA